MPDRTGNRRLVLALAAVALAVLALDQGTKAIALATLTQGERVPVLGDLFGLQLIENPGAALSLATGMTWVFTLAAVGVSVVIVRVADRLGSRAWAIALGLLLGGAVGNLVDRLARPPGFARGHVVDFLAYGSWFIGNVADIAIVLAAAWIVLLTVRGIGLDGARVGARSAETEQPSAVGEPLIEESVVHPDAADATAATPPDHRPADPERGPGA